MKIDMNFVRCSGCNTWAKYKSEIQKHCEIAKACRGHFPVTATVQYECEDPVHVVPPPKCIIERKKPGPKPIDIRENTRGKLAAFSPEVDTHRLHYIFKTEGLLDTCLHSNTTPSQLGHIFNYLWGADAPHEMQSILMYRNKVYEIHGEMSYTEYKSTKSYFVESFLANFFKVITDMCEVWIPHYRPDKSDQAQHIMKLIRKSDDGTLDIYNVIAKDDVYTEDRKKFVDLVQQTNEIVRTLRHKFHRTTVKTQ